jgi:hypothetical protein
MKTRQKAGFCLTIGVLPYNIQGTLLGAFLCRFLVRKTQPVLAGPVFLGKGMRIIFTNNN